MTVTSVIQSSWVLFLYASDQSQFRLLCLILLGNDDVTFPLSLLTRVVRIISIINLIASHILSLFGS
jgi:hypothetical protein